MSDVQTYEPGHSGMYEIANGVGSYVKTFDYAALEQEVARLKGELARYGAHLPSCAIKVPRASQLSEQNYNCDCGLDALLASRREPGRTADAGKGQNEMSARS